MQIYLIDVNELTKNSDYVLMKTQFSVILTLIVSCSAFANNFNYTKEDGCSEFRLDLPPAPSAQIPQHDQDNTFMCASYQVALNFDVWRLTFDPPGSPLTSPISVGVGYAAATNKSSLGPFAIADVLDYASKLHPCSYDIITDKFNSKEPSVFLHELATEYNKARSNPSYKTQAATSVKNCVLGSGFKYALDLKKINEYLEAESPIKFQNKVLKDICGKAEVDLSRVPGKIGKYAKDYPGHHFSAMNAFSTEIKERFSKTPKLPVMVSYCRDVLTDRKASGLLIGNSKKVDSSNCVTDPHFSSIFGRRKAYYTKSDGTQGFICQYLIRDTAGESCSAYPPDPTTKPAERCARGQPWVDEDSLLRNTSEIHFLKDK